MRQILKAACAACISLGSLMAGALTLDIANPKTDAEAVSKNAAVVARMTACKSPEKTTVSATAESVAAGNRTSIPLKVIPLAVPGTFAVAHGWPKEGNWAIRVIATNPEYAGFTTSVLVPVINNVVNWAAVKHIYHAPTAAEVDSVLTAQNLPHN